MIKKDMFGFDVEKTKRNECKNGLLRNKFIEPPFSILDTKSASWQNRKRMWKSIGIKSELGRDAKTFAMKDWSDKKRDSGEIKGHIIPSDTSIFDPALCEVLYHWFCPQGGFILDPFAGGSVRGIVANFLGYNYTGIDIRSEQINSNIIQGKNILNNKTPNWICGDSNIVLDNLNNEFDFVFTCPPYADLEVYSDLDGGYFK